MSAHLALQTAGGILAIILGVLFFIYLGYDIQDVTTDVFFVGAGVLLLRSTYKESRRRSSISRPKINKSARRQNKQRKK